MEKKNIDVWTELKEDDLFHEFLDSNFDARRHANTVIQGVAVSQQLAKLAEGINLLDKEIHQQVTEHHNDLLGQATSIETLENILEMMQARIQSLLTALDRVRERVVEPYKKICSRTAQLQRLQETCELLRRIIRILHLSKRLQSQLKGGSKEISKAAQCLNELDYLNKGMDLTGIHVIESDLQFLRKARQEVNIQAHKMLEQGMSGQSPTQMGTALQVFFNLGSLDATIRQVLLNHVDVVRAKVTDALTVKVSTDEPLRGPGRAQIPTGSSAAFRATLWTNLEGLMDSLFSLSSQVFHLEKVLGKKRDPVTHARFLDELAKQRGCSIVLLEEFRSECSLIIKSTVEEKSKENTFLKQALEGEYPKLVRLHSDLIRRLNQLTALNFDAEVELGKMMGQFENAYLSRSLSRLFDPVNVMFSGVAVNIPKASEINGVVKTIASELNVAGVSMKLTVQVSKNIAKTLQLFGVKCEQLLTTTSEASQVISSPTAGQSRNANIVDALNIMQQSINQLLESLSNLPENANLLIKTAADDLVTLMANAVAPLLSSVTDALEAIILTMHNEDFSVTGGGGGAGGGGRESDGVQCSLYMKELEQFAVRVQNFYLSEYQCREFIMQCVQPVACRSVDLFVQHASLLRPLGDLGKMILAADFAQMELAISPLCHRVSDLGTSYRLLRAFRPLIFQSSSVIIESNVVGEIIPRSTIIHFLFSRAPADFYSPHQAADWSLSRYSQWLQDHPLEKDKLLFIKGAVESYVQSVRSRKGKEYAEVYPFILKILQDGLHVIGPDSL